MPRRLSFYYEIQPSDVGMPFIRCFGKTWMVTNFLGQVLKRDVGKRVYMCAGGQHLSVESDEQYQRRLAKSKQ